MKKIIIGFCGFSGSGKTAAAQRLMREWCFRRIRFADPLKEMLRVVGLGIPELDGDLKEQPSELLCGKTPRWAMQSLGTEWGRDCIAPGFWVDAWRRGVRTTNWPLIVVDDVRYANEAEAVRELGGWLVRVVRPGLSPRFVAEHSSELVDFEPDDTINNAGSLDDLHELVDWHLGARSRRRPNSSCHPRAG